MTEHPSHHHNRRIGELMEERDKLLATCIILEQEADEARDVARHFYKDCIEQEFTDSDKAMLQDHPWLEDTNEQV